MSGDLLWLGAMSAALVFAIWMIVNKYDDTDGGAAA